ncbi:MAG TPA: alkaline phosphatase family protein [Solirubrobacterales bacterium]
MRARRKLCLVMVDSLRTDKLELAVAEGKAPHFAELLSRGELIGDCVSAFPSVTPVCCAEIATGVTADRHWISGMNWYHRVEQRYVEYGSSFEATRAFGLFRATYDVVYNMNMGHLSREVETVFESLGDAGYRTACTPFLIYRGRTRHELGLDGLLKKGAAAAGFRHAVYGPEELFYAELFNSRPVPCKPTLARPGTRDEFSACVGRELAADPGSYDFLLFSLPDNDYHAHRFGPDAMVASIFHADRCFGELVDAWGGMDRFLDQHAVILMADHSQTDVSQAVDLGAELGREWQVLQPSSDQPEQAELAVSPTARAANIYVLGGEGQRSGAHARVCERVAALPATDLIAWLERSGGEPCVREGSGSPLHDDPGARAVVARGGRELRFRPAAGPGAGAAVDPRGRAWELDGDLEALELERAGERADSERYPDGLGRLWAALTAPHAGDLVVSLELGWECVDWGGTWHAGGGSHGSLLREDSLVPLVTVGLEPGGASDREQWRLTDAAALVRAHFGVDEGPRVTTSPSDRAGALR